MNDFTYFTVRVPEGAVRERTLDGQDGSQGEDVVKPVEETPVDEQLANDDVHGQLGQQVPDRRQRPVSSHCSLRNQQQNEWRLFTKSNYVMTVRMINVIWRLSSDIQDET
jgi:hypothetical protein